MIWLPIDSPHSLNHLMKRFNMGLIQHDCLIYTGCGEAGHKKAKKFLQKRADKKFFALSPLMVNGYWTLFVFPDGSKEGWDDSELGDKRRLDAALFFSDQDGSTVQISYGELGSSIKCS